MLHTGTMLRIKAENFNESDCFVMNAMNVKAILWTACCCKKENVAHTHARLHPPAPARTRPRRPAPTRKHAEARGTTRKHAESRGSTRKHAEARMHCIVVQKSVARFEGGGEIWGGGGVLKLFYGQLAAVKKKHVVSKRFESLSCKD
jgi:hypothetical protein